MIFELKLHQITFVLEAQTNVHMGPQVGGQIRGSLWQGLNEVACTAPSERHNPQHALHCPMCFLLELEAQSPRGQNPPRPFAIRPPLAVRAEDDRIFYTGQQFEIGMTLMGKAAAFFPYLVQAMRASGQAGVGYHRGRYAIADIRNENPLTGERESLLHGTVVHVPKVSIQYDTIQQAASQLPTDRLRLRFLTPTTLKQEGKVLSYPRFKPLIARLLERCQALALHYGTTSGDQSIWEPIYQQLTQNAESIERVQDNTRWVDVRSGSKRSNRYHSIGGFVGDVLFEGDLSLYREWLLWGQSIQVGKNTVKGNGWYEIAAM